MLLPQQMAEKQTALSSTEFEMQHIGADIERPKPT